ncbi:hypothetical protein GCM10007916_12910 [Psychromonas marina]|uniref:Aminoglycoside phosphotransferase domain-containing protein n=1 Tax=Psychromonas marina TaxID=88364 RepID=A0ABQ6DYJ3_9GAMM|nr:phosphotransferase [Psychromonas marina]GLS90224.1 hypothetical protein GCM10007916_12910 [Psychromonas marina]
MNNKLLNEQEISWLQTHDVGTIKTVKQFDNALTNDVFLITNDENNAFVFKRLNQQARSEQDRKEEFLVQQLASQQQLTPQVLAHNKYYKLQQYIQGELIPEDKTNMSELLATQFHRIHKLPAEGAPKQRLVFELQRLKKQLTVNTDEIRFATMLALASELDQRSGCDTLCHGDLSLNNILQGDDKQLYILDWEYAVIATPAYDLAFCNCINQFSVDQSQALIAAYYAQTMGVKQSCLDSLQKECDLYLKLFIYINELWALCFIENE